MKMKNVIIYCLVMAWLITAGWYTGYTIKIEGQLKYAQRKAIYHEKMHDIYEKESKDLYMKAGKIKSYIDDLYHGQSYLVTLTGYHPVIEQCDSTPDITADGTQFNIDTAGNYRIAALSRDMLSRWGGPFNYGDLILVKGTNSGVHDGLYQVRDTMNQRYKNWIDVLLTPGEESTKENNILIYKLEDDYQGLFAFCKYYPDEFYSLLN
jgi:3D (Asp-Asp-Asp) domain-containing protein